MTRQHPAPVAAVEWVKGRTGDRWEVTCSACEPEARTYVSRLVADLVARRHNLGEHDAEPEVRLESGVEE